MRNESDFNALVVRALAVPGRAHMRPVIEMELLHYDILFVLEQAGLLDHLTFQGGTSLRLCHGAPRFSEDLDFVGGRDFTSSDMAAIKTCIEEYLGARYGLDITVREPHELKSDPEYADIRVDKWQISIITSPGRPDLPRQRIKIEIANVPAYTREPRPLVQNYDFLPDGYGDTLILTETLSEVMADKLVSLVNCDRYVRYRDIWDLRWLVQQGAVLDAVLLQKKIVDYRVENYVDRSKAMGERLPDIIHGKEFMDTLGRFIPVDVQERTLSQRKFLDFLTTETVALLEKARHAVAGGVKETEFRI